MSLARDVTTVGSATLLSRLLGFFRDMGIAAALGAGVFSDAFFAVLQLVNVFRRMLAEGALNAAFVPLWLRIKAADGEEGAYRFFWAVLEAMILACGALTLIGLMFAPAVIGALAPGFGGERGVLAADYLHIAAPYVVLAGVVAVLAAVLNAERRVGAAALGAVAFNAVLLLVLAWIAAFGPELPAATGALLAHGIVLAGIVQLAVTGAGFLRLRRRTAPYGEAGTDASQRTRPLKARVPLRLGFSADARRFFCARRARPGRGRRTAVEADRRRAGGVGVAGGGVVALRRQPPLRIAARGRGDRKRRRAGAGDRRERA
jgi:peptidoglycan biosynthesis protein MviN/MurJ (putative lipid II flippase)